MTQTNGMPKMPAKFREWSGTLETEKPMVHVLVVKEVLNTLCMNYFLNKNKLNQYYKKFLL